jgi:hypothetical protein
VPRVGNVAILTRMLSNAGVRGIGAVANPIIRHKASNHCSRHHRTPAIVDRLRRTGPIPMIAATVRDKPQIVLQNGPLDLTRASKQTRPVESDQHLESLSPEQGFSELSPRVERQTYAECLLPCRAFCPLQPLGDTRCALLLAGHCP